MPLSHKAKRLDAPFVDFYVILLLPNLSDNSSRLLNNGETSDRIWKENHLPLNISVIKDHVPHLCWAHSVICRESYTSWGNSNFRSEVKKKGRSITEHTRGWGYGDNWRPLFTTPHIPHNVLSWGTLNHRCIVCLWGAVPCLLESRLFLERRGRKTFSESTSE